MTPGAAPNIRQAYVTADTTLVTTAETACATVSGISTDGSGQRIEIRAVLGIQAGTGATAHVLRIRRGTDTTGAVVGETVSSLATAGQAGSASIEVQDTPGDVAGQSYTVTCQAVGASANGTVQNASLEAEIIPS